MAASGLPNTNAFGCSPSFLEPKTDVAAVLVSTFSSFFPKRKVSFCSVLPNVKPLGTAVSVFSSGSLKPNDTVKLDFSLEVGPSEVSGLGAEADALGADPNGLSPDNSLAVVSFSAGLPKPNIFDAELELLVLLGVPNVKPVSFFSSVDLEEEEELKPIFISPENFGKENPPDTDDMESVEALDLSSPELLEDENPNLIVGSVDSLEPDKVPNPGNVALLPGLALSQATHFTTSGLLFTIQTSQSQDPAGVLNLSNNPSGF